MSFENGGVSNESIKNPEAILASVTDFEPFYKALREIGPVEGSAGFAEPEGMIALTKAVRELKTGDIPRLPRVHGIRDTAERLFKQEQERIDRIAAVQSFEELEALIREIATIWGTREEPYSAEEIVGYISEARGGADPKALQYVSNTYGIRTKAEALLAQETEWMGGTEK